MAKIMFVSHKVAPFPQKMGFSVVSKGLSAGLQNGGFSLLDSTHNNLIAGGFGAASGCAENTRKNSKKTKAFGKRSLLTKHAPGDDPYIPIPVPSSPIIITVD